jgi:hypothetical protein
MALEELKATKAINYGGKRLKVGEPFKAPPAHARALRLAGSAETYVAPVVHAKPPGKMSKPRGRPRKSAATPQAAGAYERRDLTPAVSRQEEE